MSHTNQLTYEVVGEFLLCRGTYISPSVGPYYYESTDSLLTRQRAMLKRQARNERSAERSGGYGYEDKQFEDSLSDIYWELRGRGVIE